MYHRCVETHLHVVIVGLALPGVERIPPRTVGEAPILYVLRSQRSSQRRHARAVRTYVHLCALIGMSYVRNTAKRAIKTSNRVTAPARDNHRTHP